MKDGKNKRSVERKQVQQQQQQKWTDYSKSTKSLPLSMFSSENCGNTRAVNYFERQK